MLAEAPLRSGHKTPIWRVRLLHHGRIRTCSVIRPAGGVALPSALGRGGQHTRGSRISACPRCSDPPCIILVLNCWSWSKRCATEEKFNLPALILRSLASRMVAASALIWPRFFELPSRCRKSAVSRASNGFVSPCRCCCQDSLAELHVLKEALCRLGRVVRLRSFASEAE